MNFQESKTKENLARAFSGLCQDSARLSFIAKSANKEGYATISHFLEKLSGFKMAHASRVYELMLDNIKKSKENVIIEAGYPFENKLLKTSLLDSAEIESYQSKNVYPHFAKIASDEGFKDIAQIFTNISKVGKDNALKLEELARRFEGKCLYKSEEKVLWVCINCGYSEQSKEAWDNCPLCSYPKGYCKLSLHQYR